MTDLACRDAQRLMAKEGGPLSQAEAVRYLALSLTCPVSWDRPYCERGYKQLEGSVNLLEAPPAISGDHPITLGDYSALPDHLSSFGAVKGVPQAARDGLTTRALGWLARTGDAGGVVSDVAEDACETRDPLRWDVLYAEQTDTTRWAPLPHTALERAPARKVVADPAGAYSFDNPHYLDLVLHNHGHFGSDAYRNWTGFQTVARELSAAACEDVLPDDRGLYRRLARGLGPGLTRDSEPCAIVAERLRRRVLEWAARAPAEQVAPVRAQVDALQGEPSAAREALARGLVSPWVSLVFAGAGLHYLQDMLSGGHVRVQRTAYDLRRSRYEHDADSANGVPAVVTTWGSSEELLLHGDGFLLDAPSPGARCDVAHEGPRSPEDVTHCHLVRQREALRAGTTAALLHWALGEDASANGYVVRHLLTGAPGHPTPPHTRDRIVPSGTLPSPPPPFSYQSFLFSTSLDAAGGAPQVGVRTVFLTELDRRANWMTSYHLGLLARLGSGEQSQLSGEFSYMFHWRWAARFLVNAGPFAYVGLGDFDTGASPFLGVGPNVGVSVLPEGWIRLPLEVSLHYRMPLRLLDARRPLREQRPFIEAHWVELSVGLAFL